MLETQGVLDPKLAREMIAGAEAAVRHQLRFDLPLVYGSWGVAWLVGYALMALGRRPGEPPQAWAAIIFAILMCMAMGFTIWAMVRVSRGVGGRAARLGKLSRLAWWASFIGTYGFLGALANRTTLSSDVQSMLWSVAPALLIGIIYVCQGASGGDATQCALGAWITGVCAVAAWLPYTLVPWAIGVLAGGGFLVAAWVEWRRNQQEALRAH